MATLRTEEATSSTSRCMYDVFLSFRGEDTRKTFTDHLYTTLVHEGIRTFRDEDDLERGENLNPELHKAIQQSRISIIVLSKEYTSSAWCLNELVKILECKRTSGHVVLPVFYHVDPSQVRKQTGRTKEAFAMYEDQIELEIDSKRKEELIEQVKGWRAALTEVADFIGLDLQNEADG